jgi:hypothetical protein
MQLSVVHNSILVGCSDDIPVGGLLAIDAVGWRSMYFVVMPRVNLIVILVTYARYLYSINCPTVICLPSILLFFFWRDTTSELWTPVQSPLHCLHHFTITRTIYFLAYYYCFSLDTLNPLFTTNRWDWQPHRKLGAKYLVVLCAGFTLLLVKSKALDEAPYKLSGAVAKLADITFWSLAFSYWLDKPQFLTEENLVLCSSYLPIGVPNWVVICPHHGPPT